MMMLYQLQARQVLKWRREKPNQAEKIWDALSATNTDIFDTLETLNAQYRVRSVIYIYYGRNVQELVEC